MRELGDGLKVDAIEFCTQCISTDKHKYTEQGSRGRGSTHSSGADNHQRGEVVKRTRGKGCKKNRDECMATDKQRLENNQK